MKQLPVSPLALSQTPVLKPLNGVSIATAETGIRYKGRPDLLVMQFDPGTSVAGSFTQNKVVAEPVKWCRKLLQLGNNARALIVNAGNANAYTGTYGIKSVESAVDAAVTTLKCRKSEVFIASTGVIGQPMQDDVLAKHITATIPKCKPDGWAEAARAIMTTDTFPKMATRIAHIDGVPVTIHGIAKGSGMIAPNMATMLAFIVTDAALPSTVTQSLLARSTNLSFNCITVDGDTSTNDTVLLFATGTASHKRVSSARVAAIADFKEKLDSLMIELAQQIVRDGEGAQKFVTIRVEGANSDKAARNIALSIANSPLVKTAIAAEDANWGRILMAIGKAGDRIRPERIILEIGGIRVTENGAVHPRYDESLVTNHMRGQEITIRVDVGMKGSGQATVWTCDLTHGYVDINGSYRS